MGVCTERSVLRGGVSVLKVACTKRSVLRGRGVCTWKVAGGVCTERTLLGGVCSKRSILGVGVSALRGITRGEGVFTKGSI